MQRIVLILGVVSQRDGMEEYYIGILLSRFQT